MLSVADNDVLTSSLGDDSRGYFIQPTVIETKDPKMITMVEEIFGPVITVRNLLLLHYVYRWSITGICI